MKTDIMTDILFKLNRRLSRKNRRILLFMDNAPCHPESLKDNFSNIKIVFLPKNTTSKTQPLDAGVIANWKVTYKKKAAPIRMRSNRWVPQGKRHCEIC